MSIVEEEFPKAVKRLGGYLPNGDEARDFYRMYREGYKLALKTMGKYERKYFPSWKSIRHKKNILAMFDKIYDK